MRSLQKNILYGALAAVGIAIAVFAVLWDSKRAERESPAEQKEFSTRDQKIAALDSAQYSLAPKIKRYAGSGACRKDEECGVLGLGARLCDGYPEFVFFSIRDAQVEDLKSVVSRFNANMSQLNDLSMKVQSCGKPLPKARCFEGRCLGVPR